MYCQLVCFGRDFTSDVEEKQVHGFLLLAKYRRMQEYL